MELAEVDGSFAFDLAIRSRDGPLATTSRTGRRFETVHPLLWWYLTTMDPRALSLDRVPPSLVPQSGFAMARELFAPVGIPQQLAIPYAMSRHGHQTFMLAQAGADFSDADVALARRLQPMLAVVDRQSQILLRHRLP